MQYTNKQLLDKLESIGGYLTPGRITIIGVSSTNDLPNKFDDKFYVWNGFDFLLATTGTTNAGISLMGATAKGVAVWKTNKFYEDVWEPGYHKSKMKALKQVKPVHIFRDWNRNAKAEETGQTDFGIYGLNFHGIDYDYENSTKVLDTIGGWSEGCQVCNVMKDYRKIINLAFKIGKPVNYAILKEF